MNLPPLLLYLRFSTTWWALNSAVAPYFREREALNGMIVSISAIRRLDFSPSLLSLDAISEVEVEREHWDGMALPIFLIKEPRGNINRFLLRSSLS